MRRPQMEVDDVLGLLAVVILLATAAVTAAVLTIRALL